MSDKISVAKVLIQNSENKFLVVQKSDRYDDHGGYWELPGGKIEEDEDRFQTAEREVSEETGLKCRNIEDVVRVEVEKDSECVNCWIVHTDEFSGEVGLDEELQDFKWVTPEEYRNMNWHADAGYGLPAMVFLDNYVN